MIREPPRIDLPKLLYRYADIAPAVRQHVKVLEERKQSRVGRLASSFREKLLAGVTATRNRLESAKKQAELAAALEAARIKPPVIKRSFARENETPVYMCFREECNHRVFLTKDRCVYVYV